MTVTCSGTGLAPTQAHDCAVAGFRLGQIWPMSYGSRTLAAEIAFVAARCDPPDDAPLTLVSQTPPVKAMTPRAHTLDWTSAMTHSWLGGVVVFVVGILTAGCGSTETSSQRLASTALASG